MNFLFRETHTHRVRYLCRRLYRHWLSSSQSPGTPPSWFPGDCSLDDRWAGKRSPATLPSSRRQGATARCSSGSRWGGNAPLGRNWEKPRDECDIWYNLFCSLKNTWRPKQKWELNWFNSLLLFTIKSSWIFFPELPWAELAFGINKIQIAT